jgi:hypothetical protein
MKGRFLLLPRPDLRWRWEGRPVGRWRWTKPGRRSPIADQTLGGAGDSSHPPPRLMPVHQDTGARMSLPSSSKRTQANSLQQSQSCPAFRTVEEAMEAVGAAAHATAPAVSTPEPGGQPDQSSLKGAATADQQVRLGT